MNGPEDMAARVPICSANNTGFHKGTRNRQPIGRAVHSRENATKHRHVLHIPCRTGGVVVSERQRVEAGPVGGLRLAEHRSAGPARWPPGSSVEKTVPMDMPTRIMLEVYPRSWN